MSVMMTNKRDAQIKATLFSSREEDRDVPSPKALLNSPQVAIILVNWNGFSHTAECLTSLSQITYSNFFVVVVDNGSVDQSAALIRQQFPEVHLIQHEKNLGLAAANNAGLRYAISKGAEFCLLLNNDTIVAPDILSTFVQSAQLNPQAGVWGAKIFYYAEPKRIWWAVSRWNAAVGRFEHPGRDQEDVANTFNAPEVMDYANGCALFIRSEVIRKIGFMDERIFIYFEEIDWCFRAKRAGYEVRFVPSAKVWHKVAATSGGKKSPVSLYFETRNQLLWARKNLPWRERWIFYREFLKYFFPSTVNLASKASLIKRLYWDIVFLRGPKGVAKLRGLWDYLMGRFGDCPSFIRRLCAPINIRKKVLLLALDFHFPLINGGRLRTWNFLKALVPDHDVYLFNIYHEDNNPGYREPEGQALFKQVWNIKRPQNLYDGPKTIWERTVNFIRGVSWEMSNPDRPFIEQELGKILNSHSFDYILARYFAQAQYLEKFFPQLRAKIIVDLDDVEPIKMHRWADQMGYQGWYDRFRKNLNINFMESQHRKLLKRVHACLVCSYEDAVHVTRERWSRQVIIIPNAVTSCARLGAAPLKCRTILFVGSLCYTPNVEGICWFVNEVLPLIRAQEPDAQLLIVGSYPREDVIKLQDQDGVKLHQNVLEVRDYYAQSAVVIVPVRIAGGTRIKILEAGLLGRPVVSTSIGAEGLGLKSGEQCLVADSREDFAQACVSILRDQSLGESLADQNWDFVSQNYSLETVESKIRNLLLV